MYNNFQEEKEIQGKPADIMSDTATWANNDGYQPPGLQAIRTHFELIARQKELEPIIESAIVQNNFIDGSYPTVHIKDDYRRRNIGIFSKLAPWWTSGLNYPIYVCFNRHIDAKKCLDWIPIKDGASLPTIADAWKTNCMEKNQVDPPIIMCYIMLSLNKDHPAIFNEIWTLIEPKLNMIAAQQKSDTDRLTLLLLAASMGHDEVFSSDMLNAWAKEMEKSGSHSFARIGCPMFSMLMKLASVMKKYHVETKNVGYPSNIIRYSKSTNQIKIADKIASAWFNRHPSNVRGLFDVVHGPMGSDAFDDFVMATYGTEEERAQKKTERNRLLQEKEMVRIQRLEEERQRTEAAEKKKREAEEVAALAKARRIKERQEAADRAKAARLEAEQKIAEMRRVEQARIAQEEAEAKQHLNEFNLCRQTMFQECYDSEQEFWDRGGKPTATWDELEVSAESPVFLFSGFPDGGELLTFADIQDHGRFKYGEGNDWCKDNKTPKDYWDKVKEHTETITSKEELAQRFPKKKLQSIPGRLCCSTRILFRKTPERQQWSRLMQNPFYVE